MTKLNIASTASKFFSLHFPQDTARSFGGSKASQERYRIFMEATQFDVIIEHLKLAENELQEMKSRKRDLQKVLKASSETVILPLWRPSLSSDSLHIVSYSLVSCFSNSQACAAVHQQLMMG